MAPHSSALAWKIPWTEEPGRLQPMGSRRVRHDWATSLSLFTFMHWRRKWQPTPVFLPGESQGRGSHQAAGGLPSLGSHRVGHGWSDLAAAAAWSIFLSETGFFLTNAWQWTIQRPIAQFVSTALIPGKTPGILPTTDFPSTEQMAATQQKRQIVSWYY